MRKVLLTILVVAVVAISAIYFMTTGEVQMKLSKDTVYQGKS